MFEQRVARQILQQFTALMLITAPRKYILMQDFFQGIFYSVQEEEKTLYKIFDYINISC